MENLHLPCRLRLPLLLQAGAGKDVMESDGLTPLKHACKNGDISIVRCLLDAGVNAMINPKGITALETARQHNNQNIVVLLEAHLAKYPDGIMAFEDRSDWAKAIPGSGRTVKPARAAAVVGFHAGAGAADTTESGSVGADKTEGCSAGR